MKKRDWMPGHGAVREGPPMPPREVESQGLVTPLGPLGCGTAAKLEGPGLSVKVTSNLHSILDKS